MTDFLENRFAGPSVLPARGAVVVATVAMFAGAGASMGCSSSIRATFQPTDPMFKPSPGPPPRIYMESNLAEVPKSGIRSVGLIEVSAPESSGIQRVLDVATRKGQELGCWILVEHSAFEEIESQASVRFGASVFLAHGGGHSAGETSGHGASSGGTLTAAFDCVVPEAADSTAATTTRSMRAHRQPPRLRGLARRPSASQQRDEHIDLAMAQPYQGTAAPDGPLSPGPPMPSPQSPVPGGGDHAGLGDLVD
jgi:hypothetical protein